MQIAASEIQAFLQNRDMQVYLVLPEKTGSPKRNIKQELENLLARRLGLNNTMSGAALGAAAAPKAARGDMRRMARPAAKETFAAAAMMAPMEEEKSAEPMARRKASKEENFQIHEDECMDFEEVHESKLAERMKHLSDTFSQYLLYLIEQKDMTNAEVYKRALVDKKIFSKIKNNEDYHPQKITALCLCVGARLNLDETRDLLARAGYALSPCDKTDIIFSYFIENEIYDMIELDIQLEEHGLPCIIA